jgi:ribosome-binding protein aMBF1 (putative translation factor)
MLAVVKKPHIEMALSGENPIELLNWIRRKFDVSVLTPQHDASVPIDKTDFWQDMNRNRTGHLLAGARLKAELTQSELAGKVGIRQNMVSEYESGKRALTRAMARRFAEALNTDLDRLITGP